MAVQLDKNDGATPLDPDEIEGLIPSDISTQGQLNAAEQKNIAEARIWALTKDLDDVLDEPFVRSFHKRMFGLVWRWAGIYRKTEKSIGVDPKRIVIDVVDLCRDTKHWIQEKVFPVDEAAARFHHRLVLIHPFPNGNGRHSRLMADLVLITHGRPVFSWGEEKNPAAIMKQGDVRADYIAALKAADKNNFEPLLKFVRS